VTDLTWFAWALLGVAAIIVGLSKTAVPGAGTVAVAIFAAVLPAKQSTGVLLLLLIVADIFAVITYRRHTNWRALLRLAPAVVAGLILGVGFLAVADDAWVKRIIGVILLSVIAITLLRPRHARSPRPPASPVTPSRIGNKRRNIRRNKRSAAPFGNTSSSRARALPKCLRPRNAGETRFPVACTTCWLLAPGGDTSERDTARREPKLDPNDTATIRLPLIQNYLREQPSSAQWSASRSITRGSRARAASATAS